MTGTSRKSDDAVTTDFRLKVHLRFLTDRCVATRVNDRDRAEWPPHPGRVFMALAAAYFETDGNESDKAGELAALQWLERLSAPRVVCLPARERSPVTYYVPINDAQKPNKAMLQSAPGMPRSRQPRTFPTVVPQRPADMPDSQPDVTLIWTQTNAVHEHLAALERLCQNVIRIGHSSSLVMAWAETSADATAFEAEAVEFAAVVDGEPNDEHFVHWVPTETMAELACRVAGVGELERLKQTCRADDIELFGQLKVEIDSTRGPVQEKAKARFEEHFGTSYKTSLGAPEPIPPTIGMWQGYCQLAGQRGRSVTDNAYFESKLIILAKLDGPMLSVERTLKLTEALRKAVLSCSGKSQVPAWLSGHNSDETPTTESHAAFLTLPFAGHQHSDGHVMGLAIALPRGVTAADRGRWLGPLLVDQQSGNYAAIKLWGHGLPDWTLQLEDRPSPPLMLQNTTWTEPSTTWASVTPVVLDRFPKSSRSRERSAWHREVQQIIATSCQRAGLPEPKQIDCDSTCWHTGIPRAWTKQHRAAQRGMSAPRSEIHARNQFGKTSELGDGFPSMPVKVSRPAKPQVHVWLRFDRPVSGPVILGAGRFQGYGLCMPVRKRT